MSLRTPTAIRQSHGARLMVMMGAVMPGLTRHPGRRRGGRADAPGLRGYDGPGYWPSPGCRGASRHPAAPPPKPFTIHHSPFTIHYPVPIPHHTRPRPLPHSTCCQPDRLPHSKLPQALSYGLMGSARLWCERLLTASGRPYRGARPHQTSEDPGTWSGFSST